MTYQAPTGTKIGHVHLKVADLERAIAFYRDVIGLTVTQRYGNSAAFLANDGYHHHIGLNTWESRNGTPPPAGHTGLYHTAFLFTDRRSLALAIQNLIDRGVAIEGAADHGVSEAIYLRDPDGNGIELYWDRPESEWPRSSGGTLEMGSLPLDIPALLEEI